MRTLIADLTKHATVIIDAPPLLPVTDGAVLTHQADGALVVVSLGKTTYDLLDKALDTLGRRAAEPWAWCSIRPRYAAQTPRHTRMSIGANMRTHRSLPMTWFPSTASMPR